MKVFIEGKVSVSSSNLLIIYPDKPITDANIKYIDSVVLDTVHLNKEAGSFNANNIFYKTPAGFKVKYYAMSNVCF